MKYQMDKKLLTKNCVLSLGCGHSVGPRNLIRQSHEKVCVWCVFDSLRGLDRTLCLQPMAGHSAWYYFGKQKPEFQHNYKLDGLGASFEIAEGYLGELRLEANFQRSNRQGGLFRHS